MYKVVIIGAGNIASRFDEPKDEAVLTHAHAIVKNKSFILKGFYDENYKRAREAAKKWGGKAYNSIEAALEEAEVIFCCVSDNYHGKVLKYISEYNPRLVVAEKPLAVSMDEAEEIKQIYENNIPLLLNYSRRFIKEFQNLKTEIENYGTFVRGTGYYGKGIVHNGSHMIDLLNFLFGDIKVDKVLPYQNFDFKGDYSTDVIINIQNNPFYMVAVDCRVATIFEMDLLFEKARVRILDGGNSIETYAIEDSEIYAGYKNYKLLSTQKVNYSEAMEGLLKNVEGFLERDERLLCDLTDGIKVLNICMLIRGETI